ncbi:hypothetical protein PIIN_05540 [Serendipita indica DSM 11827]|uniref:Uncharacterized protein n=1 Tax=Serendipita indica (strain DSM 11827) TaxID=1109443 RepID=G4TJW1_SERID|nr:hypothetical protein PIIN_05540 [Serendipita indica DSM 11827]
MSSNQLGRYNFTIDDSSPLITYDPANAWNSDVETDPNIERYIQSSYHITNRVGATASFSFVGTGITVVGSKTSTHGAFEVEYSVQMDNKPAVNMKARTPNFVPSSTLFYESELTTGPHKLVITKLGAGGGALTIDAFRVFGSGTVGTIRGTPESVPTAVAPPPGQPNTGLIAGIVITIVVLVALLIGGIVYYRRMLKQEADSSDDKFSFISPASLLSRFKSTKRRSVAGDLNRVDSRDSGRTAVDPESVAIVHVSKDEEKKPSRLGFGGQVGIKRFVVRNPDPEPPTPALPMQQPQDSPVGGLVTVGLNTGQPRGFGAEQGRGGSGRGSGFDGPGPSSQIRQPEQARVWVDGERHIEQRGRAFSRLSLDQEWDARERLPSPPAPRRGPPMHQFGMAPNAHLRNRSEDVARPSMAYKKQQRITGRFSVSNYTYSQDGGGGRYSPTLSDISFTPRPRYEIDRDEEPITSRRSYGPNGSGRGKAGAGGGSLVANSYSNANASTSLLREENTRGGRGGGFSVDEQTRFGRNPSVRGRGIGGTNPGGRSAAPPDWWNNR